MESPQQYVPLDRRAGLAHGVALPDRAEGAALFADIAGFTPLTEALARAFGPQRGAEELTYHLNRIYAALIAEVERFGGSVIGFSGDAITCWFDGDSGARAVAAALAMQAAMELNAEVAIRGAGSLVVALKVAVAAGPIRRFVVGDPQIQRIDMLAGKTLERLAAAEHLAEQGEIVLDPRAAAALGPRAVVSEWRSAADAEERFAVVGALDPPLTPPVEPPTLLDMAAADQLAPWLLPPVYERLRRGHGEFLTELRPAVALFLNFGGIDYDHDEAAGAKLHAFVRWVQNIAKQFGGFLIQLTIGDKGNYLYIAFGAPVAHDDDTARALRTALELRSPPAELGYVQQIRIGISRGRMRTGAYGGATRRTYGVLGDEVNVAARLMQHAPPGQVFVSLAAQQAVADHFRWERLPPIAVKGKTGPVAVFRLLGAGERRGVHVQALRYTLPIVGRDAELRMIAQKIAQVSEGRGQIVAVTAEAGMGKSRLVAEIVRMAAERQFAGYAGECQSFATNSSYFVWEPIWRAFFGLDPAAPPDQQVRTLQTRLAETDQSLLPRLPLLGPALNLPIPDNELTRSLDAKLRKVSLEALLVDCVRARAHNGRPGGPDRPPLLFVLEDCHWLDPLSHDLLETLGRATADLPVLIVIAFRPPELEHLEAPRVTGLPHCTVVPLADFTVDEAAQLIDLKLVQLGLDTAALPAILVKRITAQAQGNPFYVEELLNYIRDLAIDPRDAAALRQLDLPASLQSLILSRIDQLDERQKLTLKVASVIGRLFSFRWLWGVHPELGEPATVKGDLDALSRLDLTPLDRPEPELSYLFKHIVTRDVTYQSLPFATRALLHGQLAGFIERGYGDALDQYLDLLAYHYDLSENLPKKREYLWRAGEAAQAAYANIAAIDYFRRLLALPGVEHAPVMLKLGQVLQLVGDWIAAGDLYRQAMTLARQSGDRSAEATCQRALGELLRKQGEYAEAAERLAQARTIYQALADPVGASATLAEIGEINRLQGLYGPARAAYAHSLELVGTIAARPHLTARAAALKGAGTAAWQQGDYAAAQTLYEQSLVIHRELGDRPGIANLLSNFGIVAALQGDLDAARVRFDESLAIRRELGDKQGIATSLGNLGRVAHYQGDYRGSRLLHSEALELYRQLGARKETADSLTNLGNAARDQGDLHAAHAVYAESLALYRELGGRWAIAGLLEEMVGLATAQAQPARALRLAGAAAALREQIEAPAGAEERAKLEALLEPARQALGAGAATAWEAGRAMALEQALDYALAEPAPA